MLKSRRTICYDIFRKIDRNAKKHKGGNVTLQVHPRIADLLNNEEYRSSIADEIADVMIYILRIADTSRIDPTQAILEKLRKNEQKYPVDEWADRIPDKVRNSQ